VNYFKKGKSKMRSIKCFTSVKEAEEYLKISEELVMKFINSEIVKVVVERS
jgi:hypothetical protein